MVPAKIAYKLYFGERVRIARTQRGLTQQELAEHMGLGDGQKIAAMESGKRGIKFQELELLAKALKKTTWFFTEALELVCEEKPRYLITGKVAKTEITAFERKHMNKYLGAYRFLLGYYRLKAKRTTPKLQIGLPLKANSSPELAVNAGEHIAYLLDLGTTPVDDLQAALEKKLGIMTLMIDADPAIAGVSLSLPEVSFICVNRQLPKNKRSFAIAHELFHLLTWETLAYDNKTTPKKKIRKIEQLADYFASSLLIPRQAVTQITTMGTKQTTSSWIVENATDLGVSAQALQVRIKQIEALTGRNLSGILDDIDLPKLEPKIKQSKLPPPLAKLYVQLVAKAVDEPLITTMMGVEALGCKTVYEAGDLFATYGVTAPETLEFAMPKYRKRKKLFS